MTLNVHKPLKRCTTRQTPSQSQSNQHLRSMGDQLQKKRVLVRVPKRERRIVKNESSLTIMGHQTQDQAELGGSVREAIDVDKCLSSMFRFGTLVSAIRTSPKKASRVQ